MFQFFCLRRYIHKRGIPLFCWMMILLLFLEDGVALFFTPSLDYSTSPDLNHKNPFHPLFEEC
jgi:hypothetical protein